jgi:hypothetical protein
MTPQVAAEVAAKLDLDVDDLPVCFACLSFVCVAIDCGDEADVRRETTRMTPDIWNDGLEQPARLALQRAKRRGVRHARDALDDVVARRGRSPVAKAIVRRLAEQLAERAKTRRETFAFLPWPPPELN